MLHEKLLAARLMFIQRAVPSSLLPSWTSTKQNIPAVHQDCVFIVQCNYLDMRSTHSCFPVPLQKVDDMARVGEAVTKAVVCALKSGPGDDNTNDWLNPTEVAE